MDEAASAPGHVAPSEIEGAPLVAFRLRVIRFGVAALFVILVSGLAFHQLVRSADYADLERRQAQRHVVLPSPRGIIYDREQRVLAGNRVRTAAALNLGQLRKEALQEERPLAFGDDRSRHVNVSARARLVAATRHVDWLNARTGRQTVIDESRLERAFARERTEPFVILDDLTDDEQRSLEAVLRTAGAVQIVRSTERWYPYRNAAAHVLGRVLAERVPEQPADGRGGLRTLGHRQHRGDFGLEKQHETVLQGRPGAAVARVDAFGYASGPIVTVEEPLAGKDVFLSIDIDLQLATEAALAATSGLRHGAAIVLSVRTGEVLALASSPNFDLNAVSPTISPALWRQLERAGAWLNVATQGLYPPGSTFKVFTVLAGLRSGTLSPSHVVRCDGALSVEGHSFPCHNTAGHGDVALREAIAHSCNVYAYRTALNAGAGALASEARRFHLHEPTGIDLPFEARRMLVPDPQWKEHGSSGNWTTADTLHTAIGQGYLRVSPLQMACAMASLARRETLTVPTLMHAPRRMPSGDRPPEPLDIPDGDYMALVRSLEAVVQTGIGRDAQVPGVRLAGKTGTAQVQRTDGVYNVAWFVAFAPVERPEIAIAVSLEGAQPDVEFAGAAQAGPVVRHVLGAYLDKRQAAPSR